MFPRIFVALAIVLEPLGATLLAMMFLGTPVTQVEVVGAGVMLVGVAIAVFRPVL